MNLTKSQRASVKSMFGGKCAYCGIVLGERWHADHVKPVMRDSVWLSGKGHLLGRFVQTGVLRLPKNDVLSNHFPACVPCNISKGCEDLEGWRNWLQDRIVETLRRNNASFRHAERFGRVVCVQAPVVFHFEKYKLQPEMHAV